jgi:hypothetical protein
MALFRGVMGTGAAAVDSFVEGFSLMYPKPTSAGCACVALGGSAKGPLVSSMGEWIEVASANLGVRSCFNDDPDDEEPWDDVRDGVKCWTAGRLLSSGVLIVVMCDMIRMR